MKKLYILVFSLLIGISAQAQLADGSQMPNLTITDINGVEHVLQDYLDSGKVIILDIFATWCGPCWYLHTNNVLKDLWNAYGPDGTDQLVIFSIEGDASTSHADLLGTGLNTQGDWVTGVPYYIVENTSVPGAFNLTYWPTMYIIRPSGNMLLSNDYFFLNIFDPSFDYVHDVAFRDANDASVSATYTTRNFCGSTQQPNVVATVKNMGTDTLTYALVELFVNGELRSSKEFTGSLTEFQSANVNLAGGSFTETSELVLAVSLPNNEDDLAPHDNYYEWEIREPKATQTARITITTDFWPEEIEWWVNDPQGTRIVSSTDLGTLSCDQTYTQEFPYTTDGCYLFRITDSFGDGLLNGQINPNSHSCTTPNGQASIAMGAISIEMDGIVVYENITYGTGTSVPFDFTMVSAVEPISTISGTKLYPNPAADVVLVELHSDITSDIQLSVMDIYGRTVDQIGTQTLLQGPNQLRVNISHLVNGTYFLRMTEAKAVSTLKFEKM